MFHWRPRFIRDLLPGGGGLKGKASRGAAWISASFAGVYGLRLLSTLVLTRLLAPEAFGLMSLATLFLTALNMLSDFGIEPSVVQTRRGQDLDFLRTAWTLQVLRGVLLGAAAVALAWPMAQLYGEPLLLPMICVLALSQPMRGLNSLSVALAAREVRLKAITIMEIAGKLIATVVGIAVAWATGSVWALVAGAVVASACRLVMSHTMLPPFPHAWRLERAAVWEVVTFGGWILVGTLLGYLGGQGINLVIGTLVTTEVLGLIAISSILSLAVSDLIGRVMRQVAFPVMSQVHRETPAAFRRSLARIQMVIVGGAVPLLLLLSVFAQDIIDLLYDDRYAAAGAFLSLQVLTVALGVIVMPYQNSFLATGNARLAAVVNGLGAALRVVGAIAGYEYGGVIWLLAGIGAGSLLAAMTVVALAHRRGVANLWLDAVAGSLLVAAFAVALARVG